MEHGHRQFPLGNSGLWWAPSVLPEPTRISPKVSVSKTHSTIPVEELQEVATDTNPPRTNSLTCPHHFRRNGLSFNHHTWRGHLSFQGSIFFSKQQVAQVGHDSWHDSNQQNCHMRAIPAWGDNGTTWKVRSRSCDDLGSSWSCDESMQKKLIWKVSILLQFCHDPCDLDK